MSDETYSDVTIGEVIRAVHRIEREQERQQAGFVTRAEYEENRKAQGERIGAMEKDIVRVESESKSGIEKLQTTLGRVNSTAWTAIVFPIVVAIVLALLMTQIKGA